jgi:hypothetical protein
VGLLGLVGLGAALIYFGTLVLSGLRLRTLLRR